MNNIREYQKNGRECQILFKNGYIMNLDVSFHSLENQILRATRLDAILRKRKEL